MGLRGASSGPFTYGEIQMTLWVCSERYHWLRKCPETSQRCRYSRPEPSECCSPWASVRRSTNRTASSRPRVRISSASQLKAQVRGQFPSSHPEAAGPNGRHLAVRRKRWGSPRPSENEAHASESCHAGSVNPAGEVVSVCTDPGRHPRPSRLSTPALNSPPSSGARARPGPPGSPELGGGSPESLPRPAAHPPDRQGGGGRAPRPGVLVGAGGTLSSEDYETAWGLLDVADQEVEDGHDVQEALITCAAGGADQALQAGLALAFALSEGFLSSTWNAHWSRARAHLTFLERHGNVLSEAERRELHELAHEDRGETPESEPGE